MPQYLDIDKCLCHDLPGPVILRDLCRAGLLCAADACRLCLLFYASQSRHTGKPWNVSVSHIAKLLGVNYSTAHDALNQWPAVQRRGRNGERRREWTFTDGYGNSVPLATETPYPHKREESKRRGTCYKTTENPTACLNCPDADGNCSLTPVTQKR